MPHPFFKNHGPFTISEIIKFLNVEANSLNSEFQIQDVKDLHSSSENDIVVYTYFNESVGVIGTPQIELKDGTNLDSSFGGYGSTMLDYKSSLSNLDAGIVAFGIAAGVDTRTSAVDNNTLGVNSDDSISLNSGRITKNAGGVLRDESDNVLVFNDGASTEAPMSFGEIVLEDGDTAEVLLRAASDASFTVS